jgi:hypothetical protein
MSTPIPQFDLVFIGHPDAQDPEWPGTPFTRTRRDFSSTDPNSKPITMVLNHQLYGGSYIQDSRDWTVNPAETRIYTTVTGERILTTLTIPQVKTVTPPNNVREIDIHCYEDMPRASPPGRGSTQAFLANLFDTNGTLTIPSTKFTACLEKQFETDPPMTIFKHVSPGDPKYYLAVPRRLASTRPPNIVLHASRGHTTWLYRCRVSGVNGHGIYNYVKKANRTTGTWLRDPDNEDWLLMDLNVSKYVRTNLISAFVNDDT